MLRSILIIFRELLTLTKGIWNMFY